MCCPTKLLYLTGDVQNLIDAFNLLQAVTGTKQKHDSAQPFFFSNTETCHFYLSPHPSVPKCRTMCTCSYLSLHKPTTVHSSAALVNAIRLCDSPQFVPNIIVLNPKSLSTCPSNLCLQAQSEPMLNDNTQFGREKCWALGTNRGGGKNRKATNALSYVRVKLA